MIAKQRLNKFAKNHIIQVSTSYIGNVIITSKHKFRDFRSKNGTVKRIVKVWILFNRIEEGITRFSQNTVTIEPLQEYHLFKL